MPRRLPLNSADLRAAARLATDATTGLTDLVEAVHQRIASVPGRGVPGPDGRAGGVSGLVYKTVRGVTRLAGGSLDALLGLLAPALRPAGATSPEREAVVAALNGVLGDYLAASANPLATTMAWRCDGQPLPLDAAALAQRLPQAGGRLLVLVHGLCMNDLHWSRAGHDHGAALARELGFTPLYLHYNSGLHISINGRGLAAQLERLIGQWPQPVQRLVLIGHSMGGLVARSAVHQARLAGQRWPERLDDLVFLGTPHHGAPLERAGHWVDVLLGSTHYSKPFARLTQLRSAGITDLRFGHVLEEDWQGHDRFRKKPDSRVHVPLPEGVACFTVAATMAAKRSLLADRLIGDGLVPLNSALGVHSDPTRSLIFAKSSQMLVYRTNHMAMLGSAEVGEQLVAWLK